MERQNPGMVRFMDRLNEKMELLDEKIQNKAAKAGEDYLSFFESHAEEAYKEYYLYKCFRDLRKKARESGSPEKVLEYLKKRQNGLPGHVAQAGHRRPQYKPDGEHGTHAAARMRPAARGGLRAFHPDTCRHATAAGDAAGYPDTQGKGKPEGAKTIAFPFPDEYGNKEK